MAVPAQRVITYVDGFNLYFGLRDSGFKRFYWLNVKLLAQNLMKPYQKLVYTKYFTARISGPPLIREKDNRHFSKRWKP